MASPVVGRVVSGRADATREEPANRRTSPNPLAAFTDEQLLDAAAGSTTGLAGLPDGVSEPPTDDR